MRRTTLTTPNLGRALVAVSSRCSPTSHARHPLHHPRARPREWKCHYRQYVVPSLVPSVCLHSRVFRKSGPTHASQPPTPTPTRTNRTSHTPHRTLTFDAYLSQLQRQDYLDRTRGGATGATQKRRRGGGAGATQQPGGGGGGGEENDVGWEWRWGPRHG